MEINQKQDRGDHPGQRVCENDGVNIVVAWYVKKQPQHTESAYAGHGLKHREPGITNAF